MSERAETFLEDDDDVDVSSSEGSQGFAAHPPALAYVVEDDRGPTKELGKQDIFQARDLVIEQVEVPEWGGHVYVRGMTAGQRDRLEAAMLNKKGEPVVARLAEFRVRMAITTIVSSKGSPVFDINDIHSLQSKSMTAMNRVLEVARRLSGMTEAEAEEIVGN